MVAQVVEPQHPLSAAVASIHALLDSAGDWDGLDDTTARSTMADVARAQARLAALAMRGAARLEASGAARRAGATSTGDLLARDFGGDRSAGDRLVRTARRLESAARTAESLAAGRISMDQARVIGDGLDRLPDGVTDQQRGLAERALLRDAGRLNLRDLRRRADRAPDAYAEPEEVDEVENQTLERREARARANSHLTMWDRRDGTWEGRFRIPEVQAEMLKTALDAIAAPRREHLHAEPAPAERATRMGQAFAELCSHLPTDQLPSAGGVGATLVVTIDHETLMDAVKPATLSTGTRLSAGQARQMACNLGILPAVLGTKSQVLDLGRTARLHSPAQRTAIAVRDGGCTFPGCDRPPGWCEVHHPTPWSEGGLTGMDGVMICPHHHRLVHADHWTIRHHEGRVEYRRPGDPVWRTNHRWRP